MRVYVSKQWKQAQGVMMFDHQGPDWDHSTVVMSLSLCAQTHEKSVSCVSVHLRLHLFHVFLRRLWTYKSGSSLAWQQGPCGIVRP